MTPLGDAALRQLALRVMAQHAQSAAGRVSLAAAARLAYDDLARVSTPLIGQVGVDALTDRALHLVQWDNVRPHVPAPTQADGPFARIIVSLEQQNPSIATEGAAAVFATFAGLLVTFIGEPLTTALLRKAWPTAFSDARTGET